MMDIFLLLLEKMEADRVESVRAKLGIPDENLEQVKLHAALDADDLVDPLPVGFGLEGAFFHAGGGVVYTTQVREGGYLPWEGEGRGGEGRGGEGRRGEGRGEK